MNMYATPVEGMYNYKTPRFDGTFNIQQVAVLVLGESAKRYMIRLRLPVGNLRQGHETAVSKRNVRLHRPAPKPKQYDYSDAWWQN
jgi:hypothetical protein